MIDIQTIIHAPLALVWECWTDSSHIVHWNYASDDWHTPKAINDLQIGGKFLYRMESKDGKIGFDFWGIYTEIIKENSIKYTLGDDRKVEVHFETQGDHIILTQSFQPETENSIELQRSGWQSILDNFKNYVISNSK